MLKQTRTFFRKNRTNLAIGAGIVGSIYIGANYVISKLTEAKNRMATDRIAKENLRRRFEQNQEDCSFTVLALLPTATERILELLPVEQITHQLQEKKAARLAKSGAPSEVSFGALSVKDDDGISVKSLKSEPAPQTGTGEPRPKRTKAQLWNELKITSITRAYTLIYTLALLCFLTRIQLNLLGRRNYLSSVISLAERDTESPISLENNENNPQLSQEDYDVNRKYLTFSWWLLHRGWRKLLSIVEVSVKQVFGPLNPRDDISMSQLRDLTLQIRKTVEGDGEFSVRTSWLPFLLPPNGDEDLVLREAGVIPEHNSSDPTGTSQTSAFASSPPLRRLLDETSDLIDSPPGRDVLSQLFDAAFNILLEEKLAEQAFKVVAMPMPGGIDHEGRIQEVFEVPPDAKTKVANVLAVVTRQAHLIGNGIPNEYLKAMEKVQDLSGFSAIIYSNFDLSKASPMD
ncbi:peroxin [Orbilia oligospora]|uniref:Peroxin n=1 Tax=Orbilia oligospora TaxID=2813651 RepID=A0A7C8JBN7_ORBOL|nr:peroxin [Orbilia oligospora]KAF3193526.1 peroxin [Orbilia oligospora]KAF3249684.1 peroxin, variant 2 [Orbilia oligospora]TGJ73230.1 peroxin [Orbilia oligospora]